MDNSKGTHFQFGYKIRLRSKSTQFTVALITLLVTVPGIAAERCAAVYLTPDGQIEHEVLPSFSVTGLLPGEAFALPPEAPPLVRSIYCARETFVLGVNDHKPLQAGYPLNIASGGRIGVLEVVKGQLRFRMLKGEMTEQESVLMLQALNDAQERYQTKIAP